MAQFCSRYGNARISFPPETFGLIETGEDLIDNQGNLVVDKETGDYRKKRKARDPVILKGADQPLITTDEDLISCLRKHSGNDANGGSTFWEETQAVLDSMAVAQGMTIAHVPDGGVTDHDVTMIQKLYGYSKRIPPPAQDTAMLLFGDVIERFSIRGVTIPPRDRGLRLLKARIIEALSSLEDLGVASANAVARGKDEDEDEDEGGTDTPSSAGGSTEGKSGSSEPQQPPV